MVGKVFEGRIQCTSQHLDILKSWGARWVMMAFPHCQPSGGLSSELRLCFQARNILVWMSCIDPAHKKFWLKIFPRQLNSRSHQRSEPKSDIQTSNSKLSLRQLNRAPKDLSNAPSTKSIGQVLAEIQALRAIPIQSPCPNLMPAQLDFKNFYTRSEEAHV